MARQVGLAEFHTLADSYDYILLGEEHFFGPHQRFARKVSDELRVPLGVEMVPVGFSQKPYSEQLEFLSTLNSNGPFVRGDYTCLNGKIVGLRSCPNPDPTETLTQEFNAVHSYWKGNDEGYSRMLADNIKKSGTKLNLLGIIRMTSVSQYLPDCIEVPQLFSGEKSDHGIVVMSGVIYCQPSFVGFLPGTT